MADENAIICRGRGGIAPLSALAALSFLALWVSTSFAQVPGDGYRVFRPDGAGPHPAVAFVAGCSGFSPVGARKFYERVAEKLRSQGYVVLSWTMWVGEASYTAPDHRWFPKVMRPRISSRR